MSSLRLKSLQTRLQQTATAFAVLALLLFSHVVDAITCPATSPPAGAAVAVSSANPQYFTYKGTLIPLLGISHEYICHLAQPASRDSAYCTLANYPTVLGNLNANKNNVVRLWTIFNHSPGTAGFGSPFTDEQPFIRSGGKWDLRTVSNNYLANLEAVVCEAYNKNGGGAGRQPAPQGPLQLPGRSRHAGRDPDLYLESRNRSENELQRDQRLVQGSPGLRHQRRGHLHYADGERLLGDVEIEHRSRALHPSRHADERHLRRLCGKGLRQWNGREWLSDPGPPVPGAANGMLVRGVDRSGDRNETGRRPRASRCQYLVRTSELSLLPARHRLPRHPDHQHLLTIRRHRAGNPSRATRPAPRTSGRPRRGKSATRKAKHYPSEARLK
jgi:hypothetical protein